MRNGRRILGYACAGLALAAMAVPAQAQFRGIGRIINDARNASNNQDEDDSNKNADNDAAQTSDECKQDSSPSVGRAILGGILGRTSRDVANRAGISSFVPVSEFSDQINAAIACRLDPEEQEQAADATLNATRGTGEEGNDIAPVGSSSSWRSNTRDDVSGTSTIVGRQDDAPGGVDCITVTDVIIVSGEETRAEKRMCRPPGSARYSIVV